MSRSDSDNGRGNWDKERTVSPPLLSNSLYLGGGPISPVIHKRCSSIADYLSGHLFVEVKMNKSSNNRQCISSHSLSEKLGFARYLDKVWQDLQDHPHWKYKELSPVSLLEKSALRYTAHSGELARANWFWRRRPRLLRATSCIIWLLVALGLPLWLFIVPAIGVPLLIIAVVMVNTEIVRSVRWRRDYELSIDRLIRTSTNNRDTFGVGFFA